MLNRQAAPHRFGFGPLCAAVDRNSCFPLPAVYLPLRAVRTTMRTTMCSPVHQSVRSYMLIDERERQHVAVQIAHSAHVPHERFARLAIVGRDDDLFSMPMSDSAQAHSAAQPALHCGGSG